MVLPDFSEPSIALFFAVYCGALVLAALLGDWPERAGALVFGLIPIAQSVLYTFLTDPRFGSVDWILVAVDTLAIAGLSAIAFNANRDWWPELAVPLMVWSLIAHVSRAFSDMFEQSYAQFNFVPTLLAVVVLLIGAINHRARRLRGLVDPPWTPYNGIAKIKATLAIK